MVRRLDVEGVQKDLIHRKSHGNVVLTKRATVKRAGYKSWPHLRLRPAYSYKPPHAPER